jgi:hypothetical protein
MLSKRSKIVSARAAARDRTDGAKRESSGVHSVAPANRMALTSTASPSRKCTRCFRAEKCAGVGAPRADNIQQRIRKAQEIDLSCDPELVKQIRGPTK